MDLEIFNTNFERSAIIDTFESMIWTDRYSAYGDFEIYTPANMDILNKCKQDYYVAQPDSDYWMIIESVKIETNVELGTHVTIKGRSLESILTRRIVWDQTTVSGSLQNGIKKLINDSIINPSISYRKITNFIFKDSTDPAITGITGLDFQFTGATLYEAIKKICDVYSVGFKVTLNSSNQFVFELYAGINRSYDQDTLPYVVFSPDFENLINSNYLESRMNQKNVGLVAGEGEGSERKTYTVGTTTSSGLGRRELFVDARDISSNKSDQEEMITALSFSTTTKNGLTMTNLGEGKAKVTGTPTAYGFTMTVKVKTIASVPKGIYRISGCPSDTEHYHYSIQVVGIGTASNANDVEELVVNSTKTNVDVNLIVKVDSGTYDHMSVSSTFTPKLTFYKLHIDDYNKLLSQRGKEQLAENQTEKLFEGKVEPTQMYRYGEHFFMGDIVQLENEYAISAKVRIVEFIHAEDQKGVSMYPTFDVIE